MEKVLVLGGPGNIGTSTINTLVERNYRVSVLTRPKKGKLLEDSAVRYYFGDRYKITDLQRMFKEVKPDIVIDFICFTPEDAQISIDVFGGNIDQYVFVSTCDIYGYPLSRLPMRESDPWTETRSQYAADKKRCELLFARAAERDGNELTIVRPSYSLGPEVAISFFNRDGGRDLISRLRNESEIIIPGDGTTLMHASAAFNTGKMIAEVVGQEKAYGKSYTCGQETAMTHEEYIECFARAVGIEARTVHIPADLLLEWEIDIHSEGLLSELTKYNVQFSHQRFKEDFPEYKWTMSVEEAVKSFVSYQDKHGLIPDKPEYTHEDKIITAWQKMKTSISLF